MVSFCGDAMSIIPDVIPSTEISQSDFDKICDAIEAEIARLQNIDYASPEAQRLLDIEADIVVQRYQAGK